jgi:hypothetical protein
MEMPTALASSKTRSTSSFSFASALDAVPCDFDLVPELTVSLSRRYTPPG